MTVTLETAYQCPCGHRIRAVMTATVRVNKMSMRTLGPMLGFIERDRALDAEGNSNVDAYWSLWLRWVAYLADSVRHEGFEVH